MPGIPEELCVTLFKLLDTTERGYVTLRQIRYAILCPTKGRIYSTTDIYEYCVLQEPRRFIFMLDVEFLQTFLLEYQLYYLEKRQFIQLVNEAHGAYAQKCDEYVRELYDLCESTYKLELENDSDSEEEQLQSSGGSIPWKTFKALVTKNKIVKDKVQQPLNSFYRFISQPRFYAEKWFKADISKEQLVQFIDRSRYDILNLRSMILKQVHSTINKICKTVDKDHIETDIAIVALTKNKNVHKLLQQAPGMQIFSLPTVTSEYMRSFRTKRSGEMSVMEFLQAMDNVEANRFRKVDLRKFYDKLNVKEKGGCVDRSEIVQCLKDLDRRRYEENKLVLVETQRYPVLFHRDVVVDKMRELDTKRMGEVSFQEFFEFCQQLDFEFQDRLVIRKCFNYIRNNLEDHHRSVLDKGKTDHFNAQRVKKASVMEYFADKKLVRQECIRVLTSERKVFEFLMHVPDLAKDLILTYHTKKGDSFSFEELTECMFELRESFPHRVACLKLFDRLAKSNSVDSKTNDDYIEETKEEMPSPRMGQDTFVPYALLQKAIRDEWESFPEERDIILDSEGMLGILLSNQDMALNHHFYRIRREEIENVVRNIKKKSDKRNMIQTLISNFSFERFFTYVKDLYETRAVREVGMKLFDSVIVITPKNDEEKSVDNIPFAVDPGSEEDAQPLTEIQVETLATFLQSEKFVVVRTEMIKSLQSNGITNILEPPEIIIDYLGHQKLSSLSPIDLIDTLFEVIGSHRNRKILFEIYCNIKTKANQMLLPRLLFEGLEDNHLLMAKLDEFNILQFPKLYEEGLLSLHRGLKKAVSFNQFYEFVAKIQPQLKVRRILRTLFDLIDEDNSESIDKREVLRAFLRNQYVRDLLVKMESLQVLQKPELFEKAFMAMDTSGDGEVSFEEFVTFALASQAENDAKMARRAPNSNGDVEENPHTAQLKAIKEEIEQMSTKLNADEVAVKAKKEQYERSADNLRILIEDLQIKENQYRELKRAAAVAAGEDVDSDDGADTPRDMWGVLRQQKGDDADMVRDKMYEGPYGIDEENQSTKAIFEELHGLQELFDTMWESVTGNQPQDPYEHMIQILRGFQASRRVKLGIDLTLRDVNDALDISLREQLWIACRDDKPELIQKAMEEHEISQNHRCFYVDMHNLRMGDEVPGYGYELEPDYHKGYDSTCLHVSSWFGSDKTVKFLIDNFVDTAITDIMHRSARDVAKTDSCKLLLHHGSQRNNWKEYHNPMIPVKRVALQTHWRKKKAHQGTKWKRKFDDRDERYQEDKLHEVPPGITIEQYNSITWLTGKKKIEEVKKKK